MKAAFAADFEKTLVKMKWPGKELTLAGNLRQEWSRGVETLLELQEPYVFLYFKHLRHISIHT